MTGVRYKGGLLNNRPADNLKERIKYREFARQQSLAAGVTLLDTIQDKKLYGFLDPNFSMIEPNPEVTPFGQYSGDLLGLNYVVSQFNEFRDAYLSAASAGRVQIPELVSGLVPKKSYISMEERYQKYQNVVIEKFLSKIVTLPDAEDYLQDHDFIEKISDLLFTEQMKRYKFTKSGYVLTEFVSAYETGLYVDLSPDQDVQIDQIKADFMSDPAFKCYGEIANQYGFYVDKYCPWRLVLNIKHPKTQENILNKNYNRTFIDFYYSEYYYKIGLDDFWNLKSIYKKIFLSLVNIQGTELSLPFTGISDLKWIEIFLLHRFREIGILRESDYRSSDNSPTENKKRFQNVLGAVKTRYALGPTASLPLTHNSGLLAYIENLCAQELKKQLTNN